jgi:hypothetical protein
MTKKHLRPKDPYFHLTNPKDLLAQLKLDPTLIPETAIIEEALAWYEGALKYGRYNWRMKRVKVSVYLAAIYRHIFKFIAGDWSDSHTMIAHMAYVRCCAGIIIDAQKYGCLVDDRPPRGKGFNVESYLDNDIPKVIEHLKHLFRKETPKQYVLGDPYQRPKRSK